MDRVFKQCTKHHKTINNPWSEGDTVIRLNANPSLYYQRTLITSTIQIINSSCISGFLSVPEALSALGLIQRLEHFQRSQGRDHLFSWGGGFGPWTAQGGCIFDVNESYGVGMYWHSIYCDRHRLCLFRVGTISQRQIPGADGPFRSWRRYIEDSVFLMTDAWLMELRAS